MCGIAGWVGRSAAMTQTAVRAMNCSHARRGPDADGLHVWRNAVFGHRRLSIFDVSDAGKQPMLSPDGKLGVVFNGAVYNFLDLRSELEGKGYRFSTQTDTEVLIHGYREWGLDGLVERLHGMFAIGLWDDSAEKLYLIRDRLGVKPLYYTVRPDGSIAFASTARALRDAQLADDLDPIGIAEFLEYGYVTDARSIYRGAHKLAAGHILDWSDRNINVRCYWTPPALDESKSIHFEEAVERTEHLFLEAVKMRLFADVPVAALLSGGVDSTLVCWAISHLGANLKAYTVATPGDIADESQDAIATARILGIRHEILPMHPEDIKDISELVAAFGEPFGAPSALGMLQLSRAIKPEATVLLTGDGGDDVFLGYPEHKHLWMAQRLARYLPAPLAKLWYRLRSFAFQFPALQRPAHFLDYATGGFGAVAAAHDGWPKYVKQGLLGERLSDIHLWQRELPWSPESARRVLTEMLAHDRSGRFVAEYLTKVDGSTMYYALEARAPFLDQKLWEFASTLPYALRLKGGQLKAVLRELSRRKVGDRVATGKKRGFTIPVQRWLAGRWLPQAQDLFENSRAADAGWINSVAMREQLKAAGERGWAPLQLWYVFVLENWLRREESTQMSGASAEVVESLA